MSEYIIIVLIGLFQTYKPYNAIQNIGILYSLIVVRNQTN